MTSTLDRPSGSGTASAELAPFAVVRRAALPYPERPQRAEPWRAALRELAGLLRTMEAAAPGLADALAASAARHSLGFHRAVVLPLRRDVHNGRVPRESLVARLGDLPERVPGLAGWLAAARARARLEQELAAGWGDALTAEREVLAGICTAEPLRQAVTLTGRDLLYGVDRTAACAGRPDKRARQAEPTVLRYALRATSKTSPLSWYTSVGLGWWDGRPGFDPQPRACSQVNHVLVTRLLNALLGDPGRRVDLPHRLAPALRERDGRVVYQRDIPQADATHVHAAREERVELALTGPIAFLLRHLRQGERTPRELAELLARNIASPAAAQVAGAYVGQMIDVGLIVPVWPVDPQDPDVLGSLARWLETTPAAGGVVSDGVIADLPVAGGSLAGRLASLRERTAAFSSLPAAARPAALAALADDWRETGELVGADLAGVPVLMEDVTLPRPLALGARHGRADLPALARLTPLTMLFDHHLFVRRLVTERFVDLYGSGARVPLSACTELMSQVWSQVLGNRQRDPGIEAAREQVRELISAAGDPHSLDREIPGEAVNAAADLLPAWVHARPVSYSYFVQPVPGGGLAVNHVYAGFARFTSRFLPQLDPSATAAVTEWLHRVLGPDTVQYRPVLGFNANLHPMVTAREVGEDPRWADLPPEELDLVHDEDTELVRVVDRATGRPLSVLYLGFLVPYSLPDRTAPLTADLVCGHPALSGLAGRRETGGVTELGRLTHDGIVLQRRKWKFADDAATALREAFRSEHPAVAAARLRARHGLPEHLFAEASTAVDSLAGFLRKLRAAKPQYVDLGNALHLRCLPAHLERYPEDIALVEALPVPGTVDEPVTELIVESCWRAS
ncbi:lantibiotic dehydratase [Nonomuraea sp. LP-02]|uniref:lantibiotic dehydratase n=1 Tax=Nonomuraea sp. LP-02 TaxID=3097960 RepID=UPI002E32FF40|nr:lantibiotic dehydratase [Nonomuraea sp. LP-02]MED7925260.1 lantibiotic dehydratase [Nonomuraea sp. LP-02]